jgi:transposase
MGMAEVKEILVAWDAGESVSIIGRQLGYTRPTVRKYVRAATRAGLTRGGGRRSEAGWDALTAAVLAQVACQRAPGTAGQEVRAYHDYLAEWVGTVQLTVLHQRLREERGLQASWGTFYRYVAAHWPGRLARRPRPTIRLADPPPGLEAQVDFFYLGLWLDPQTGRRRRVFAFLMTLSHSRHQFLYPVLAEDGPAWLEGHIAAFTFFGGVPKRVVPDNLTAAITTADRYDPRVNRAYGELARYYGFLVDPARAARPTDKPRVERSGQYARQSFFRGREWASLEAMRAEAARWCREVAGQRTHGTTREHPLPAFEARERAALAPLPARPWERVSWVRGVVQADCHLRAAGTWYSVPASYIRRTLDARVGERLVEVFDGAHLVTTHVRQERGRVTRTEHYPLAGRLFLTQNPGACLAHAQALGPATTALVAALLEQPLLSRLREAQALLRLDERYPAARLERACGRALAAADGRYRTVRAILARDLDRLAPEEAPATAPAAGAFLRGPLAFGGEER